MGNHPNVTITQCSAFWTEQVCRYINQLLPTLRRNDAGYFVSFQCRKSPTYKIRTVMKNYSSIIFILFHLPRKTISCASAFVCLSSGIFSTQIIIYSIKVQDRQWTCHLLSWHSKSHQPIPCVSQHVHHDLVPY